ncbi:DNA polymerase III subunit epsilon [Methylobacterium dankookense]|uniref:DNA polymerase III subunit epsilon n=1 Tax=Methylobacterium dankookense TaxID=560405 RepID=A0A564FTY0_9HYPH|nr:DNA polymerase III subunit epsilon [Methylobacterium dankookense]GJD57244.1 DNA polymerase III subunit epsilon [Methylobacterium dankookense]VUF11533.1 DNA polymerase III subunit epsilon [Methylobacterium dankookense]
MLREIVLDTETTGTDAKNGDRLIEVGCVELINHVQTGRTYHAYVNPQRAVHPDAFAVHGLSDAFLADKPAFGAIVADLVAFCDGGTLVIHNAPFDVGFLNMEYARLGAGAPPPIVLGDVVDTLILARKKHPGAGNSLDMLCNRYGIDRSRRTKHGALLDAQILAEVYVELLGGKQTGFDLGVAAAEPMRTAAVVEAGLVERRARPHRSRLTDAERARHDAFRAGLGGQAIWADYIGADEPG